MPLTLLAAFLIFSKMAIEYAAFRVLLVLCIILSGVAVASWMAGNVGRASYWMATPNLLATLINVSLCPLIAYFLLKPGSPKVLPLIVFLLFALFCTQSRGGYLGLMASLFGLWLLIGKNVETVEKGRWQKVAVAGLLALGGAWAGSRLLAVDWDGGSRIAATLLHGDTSLRGAIYTVALQALRLGFPVGVGAHNFRYYFEMLKGPESADRHNNFVHSDFLQLAVENGLAGLISTVALLSILCFQLYKYSPTALKQSRISFFMAATALTAVFAQALVDFPLYVPLLIAVVGACLGVLNREFVKLGAENFNLPHFQLPRFSIVRPDFVRQITVIVMSAWLGLPAFSEMATAYGRHALLNGDTRAAALSYSLARELQPHDGAAYWREATLLEQLAVLKSDTRLAARADELYRRGYEENPLEVANVLGRISLHRQHRDLLTSPVSAQELVGWVGQARKLQPYNEAVYTEYLKVLVFAGHREKAVEQARVFLKVWPSSRAVQSYMDEIKSDGAGE